jgi:quercetin dioxygenase-like cupin family protein
MNNREYVSLVNAGDFPQDVKIPADQPFIDSRGVITNLWLGHSASITLITSVNGAKRAAHRHTNDWHGTFIIEGQVKYIEEENGVQQEWIFNKGDQFFTKPGVYHEMIFLQDSVMITANGIIKDHLSYNADVKRGK